MRVITGSAHGMRLEAPEGMDVRPTTDKVKESIFNIVQFDIPDSTVLDLFAGCGQLGIEALSRGAKKAYFIDSSSKSLEFVRRNLEHTHFENMAEVRNADSLQFLKSTAETFDIAFLDPPYRKQITAGALPLLAEKMSEEGVIVCETAFEEELPETVGKFGVFKEYKYGKIKLTLYKKREEA